MYGEVTIPQEGGLPVILLTRIGFKAVRSAILTARNGDLEGKNA